MAARPHRRTLARTYRERSSRSVGGRAHKLGHAQDLGQERCGLRQLGRVAHEPAEKAASPVEADSQAVHTTCLQQIQVGQAASDQIQVGQAAAPLADDCKEAWGELFWEAQVSQV